MLSTAQQAAVRFAQNHSSGQDGAGNHLIACLPGEIRELWRPELESVDLSLGQVLYEYHAPLSFVYFPVTAIVSLQYATISGGSTETAVVGNEGMVGFALIMGGNTTPSRAVVQSAGKSLRLRAPFIQQEFPLVAPVTHLLLRFTQALITQLALTAVCNRHHSLEQQLCRCLLLSLDRLSGATLLMTHEALANRLGVRREGVTESAARLQRAGILQYARGHIHVLDRARLEARACECYAVLRKEYRRLLPDRIAT
jgi:CRP-like cAMP-binding protein